MQALLDRRGRVIQDPGIVKTLLNDPRAGWLWLVARVWVGLQWLEAGSHKITEAAWVGGGAALKGFWSAAVAVPAEGRPPIAFDWYRAFLQTLLDAEAYTWFGKLVAYGELLVGIAMIVGAFTGIAAFFGAFMNWNFMMAGSASVNPVLFVLSVGLIMAWKVAGHIGLDYILLPMIGTPWRARERRAEAIGGRMPELSGAGD